MESLVTQPSCFVLQCVAFLCNLVCFKLFDVICLVWLFGVVLVNVIYFSILKWLSLVSIWFCLILCGFV